jgi:hypothetical protein
MSRERDCSLWELSGSRKPQLARPPHAISVGYAAGAVPGNGLPNALFCIVTQVLPGNRQREEKAMKNTWKWNALAIAAAMAVTAVTGSAQETTMKANVPFEFSINGGARQAAGNYAVTRDRSLWLVRSEETGQAVIIRSIAYDGKDSETPSLSFNCVHEHCELRAIHAGGRELGAELPAPRLSKSDAAEVALVNIPLESKRGA